ncbi:chromate ion transporter-like protein [Clathrospora elynae]|uniref:Chromate ion transporter-like protein n=1 Tax=Clathrospora elynae TaxID=706981 RepID=A0A6A5SWY6_9PLEO|nr:chromate ion transporter-like protein [Clathrospora elynae]
MPFHSIISWLQSRTRTPRQRDSQRLNLGYNASSRVKTEKLEWRLAEVFSRMWDLGFTAFGGPPVHFQILHKRFVEGTGFQGGSKWLDEQTYQELFALCQALPGPASTKLCFCIALIHAGIGPAVLAFFLWSLPGAIGMYGLSLGVQKMPDRLPPIVYALLSGLNASTVGIVALAAVQLAEMAIKDCVTRILVIFGACAGLCYNAIWFFPILIVIDGATTVTWYEWLHQKVGKFRAAYAARKRRARNEQRDVEDISATQSIPLHVTRPETVKRRLKAGNLNDRLLPDQGLAGPAYAKVRQSADHATRDAVTPISDTKTHKISVKVGISLIVGLLASFIVVMVIRGTVSNRKRSFNLFSNMYLAGTIIFGGGPVVIPLLRFYVVDPGWISPRDFLLGLAIIQTFFGPNFNFAVYLGALALASTGAPTIIGAFLGFIGIFYPGIILAIGVQFVWQVMRAKPWVLSSLRGINATAVGLVFTAVYRLWEIGYLTPQSSDGRSLANEPWW